MRPRVSEQGAVAPTSLLAAAILAVAVGAAGYAMTSGHSDQTQKQSTTPAVHPKPSAKPSAHPSHQATHTTPPAIIRGNYTVLVYNNSSVSKLAQRTSDKAKTLGWNTLTPQQWTASTLAASTVFYPPTMKDAAQKLAADLGITAVAPATSAMGANQLTVILAAGYTG